MKRVLGVSFLGFLSLFALPGVGISGGKKKVVTEVTVLDAKGKPASGRIVILEFEGPKGLVFTDPARTVAGGVVKIKHVLQGNVKVWVDGDHGSHGTTGQAPGKITVDLGRAERFRVIDSHALKASAAVEQSVSSLAEYLAKPAKNDLEKVRANFRWITDRIAYDVDGARSGKLGDNTLEGVLKNRKCVCEGFARLFEALAKEMKLEAIFVGGHLKDYFTSRDRHAWCAVKIDGVWQLFDPTAGVGRGPDGVKRLDEYYFQSKPEFLQFSHFPDDPKWQLCEPRVTKQDFDGYPAVQTIFFERGISADRMWKALKEEKIKEFCQIYSSPGRPVLFHDIPLSKKLKAGVKYRFQVDAADFTTLVFRNANQRIFFQRNGPLFEGLIAPRPGSLDVSGMKGSKGDGILRYEVE
jgi:hypothetical protein